MLWQNVWEEEAALRGPPLKPWVSYSDVGPGPSKLSFEASSSFETLWGLLTSSEGAWGPDPCIAAGYQEALLTGSRAPCTLGLALGAALPQGFCTPWEITGLRVQGGLLALSEEKGTIIIKPRGKLFGCPLTMILSDLHLEFMLLVLETRF